MGAQWSKQIDRQKAVIAEKKMLRELQERSGSDYLGSSWHPTDRKNWMSGLDPKKAHINQIVEETGKVCNGILTTFGIDVVTEDVKRFVSETESEIVILEIRTEFGRKDPPGFENYLCEQLGELLIQQDDNVFEKTILKIYQDGSYVSGSLLDLWTDPMDNAADRIMTHVY
ncbi:hypothetical protein L1987_63418 [Smallanthus sonchifolius]|uniref:Uncharacterized protein n=1 Tax=Smallanthus sonchifolius TaxID=185202 RepID=A0ACB9CD78_9ASTR|nr:hypothetical protein L1987_63418 [Smallanthus sonchifolius]